MHFKGNRLAFGRTRHPGNCGLPAPHALNGYLSGQSNWPVNYAGHHRAGLRVGKALTEATANFRVNRRMNKSQQMRWTRPGAGLLLQGCCAV